MHFVERLLCDIRENTKKPVIPVPCFGECMTGFEYAFAGFLVSEGLVVEGIKVVRAVRKRLKVLREPR